MSDHEKFMNLALAYSEMSPDPSTKVGAIIVNEGQVIGWGCNHVPKQISYTREMIQDREWKYSRVIHAEHDALSCIGSHSLFWPVMYVTHHPCDRCAISIIHAGIRQVYTRTVSPEMFERWPGMKVASKMFLEAKIPVTLLEL